MNPQDHLACPSSNPETAATTAFPRAAGRHPVLDDGKQQQILAILTAGGSRRTAARYVGCAAGTITQTAQRDPAFAEQLAHAEQAAEIKLLRLVTTAASQPQYWRAAAWMLERRNPEDFALRKPETFTAGEIQEQLAIVLDLVVEAVPAECRAQVVEKLQSVSAHVDARLWPAEWNHRDDDPLPEEASPQCDVPKPSSEENAVEASGTQAHESQTSPQAILGETCFGSTSAASPQPSGRERQPIVEHPTSGTSETVSHAPGASAGAFETCARATRRNKMQQRRRRAKIGSRGGRRQTAVPLPGNSAIRKPIPV